MTNLTIRLETEKDYKAVENLTREAFWNVYKPGADEHSRGGIEMTFSTLFKLIIDSSVFRTSIL